MQNQKPSVARTDVPDSHPSCGLSVVEIVIYSEKFEHLSPNNRVELCIARKCNL